MKIKIALKTKIFQGQIHKFKIDVLSLKNLKTSIYIIVNILKNDCHNEINKLGDFVYCFTI